MHGPGEDGCAYHSRVYSQRLPARSDCPHLPSPFGDLVPTSRSPEHDAPQYTTKPSSGGVASQGYVRCSSPRAACCRLPGPEPGRQPAVHASLTCETAPTTARQDPLPTCSEQLANHRKPGDSSSATAVVPLASDGQHATRAVMSLGRELFEAAKRRSATRPVRRNRQCAFRRRRAVRWGPRPVTGRASRRIPAGPDDRRQGVPAAGPAVDGATPGRPGAHAPDHPGARRRAAGRT